MPPVLVRPYVRVIPITHVAPAYPRRSPIAPRPVPSEYRPRHLAPAEVMAESKPQRKTQPKIQPQSKTPPSRRRPTRGRRRTPALAWGALLVALATSGGLALRAGAEQQGVGQVPAAESRQQPAAGEGRLQMAVVVPASARLARSHPDGPSRQHQP
ncbi:hypothetical protein [Dactylosporangium sp. CA-139066]|uniref:hypothetical protein n=1 Tax=Dactylosporangium sp. CA-139066 TaxID=3239930 RepID=UPI003D8B8299